MELQNNTQELSPPAEEVDLAVHTGHDFSLATHSMWFGNARLGDLRREIPFIEQQVELHGRKLHWLEWSNPELDRSKTESIVFIHGLADGPWTFHSVASELAKEYRVLALSLPGHGHSEYDASGAYSSTTYQAAINDILDFNQLQHSHFIAASFGGLVATHFIASTTRCVESLILVDSLPSLDVDITNRYVEYFRNRFHSFEDILRSVLPSKTGIDEIDKQILGEKLARLVVESPDGSWRFKVDPQLLNRVDVSQPEAGWSTLNRIQCPILLLQAEKGTVLTEASVQRFQEKNGDAITITGAGHKIHSTHPKEFVEHTRSFLKNCP